MIVQLAPETGRHQWIQVTVAALPGLVAAIALIFSFLSIHATDTQLTIDEATQDTSAYNSAIANLSSPNALIQVGGIFALQRLMIETPKYQPGVIQLLSTYVRLHAPFTVGASANSSSPSTEVQAALAVLTSRNPAFDGPAIVNLADTNLANADLTGAYFANANLSGSNLTNADLTSANLVGADLEDVYVSCPIEKIYPLAAGWYSCVILDQADMRNADLTDANLTFALLRQANLSGADLYNTNFRSADLYKANLSNSDLSDAIVKYAYMQSANLSGTN